MNEALGRKRFHSINYEAAPAPKMAPPPQAPGATIPPTEQLSGFADIMTVQLLRALNNTETSQRMPLLEDIILRVQWLKEQQSDADIKLQKKQLLQEAIPKTRDAQPFDNVEMQKKIRQQIEMLNSMAKVFRLTQQAAQNAHNGMVQNPAPPAPTPAPAPAPIPAPAPPPSVTLTAPSPAPPIMKSPTIPIPIPVPVPPKNLPTLAPVPRWALLKQNPAPEPVQKLSPPTQLIANKPDQQQMVQYAEDFMKDLHEKQREMLDYIKSAHGGGKVTNSVLQEYMKHRFVSFKKNGKVEMHVNPFFHLLNEQTALNALTGPPPVIDVKTPSTSAFCNPTSTTTASPPKSTTPIPAPPVLKVNLPKIGEDIPNEQSSFEPLEK